MHLPLVSNETLTTRLASLWDPPNSRAQPPHLHSTTTLLRILAPESLLDSLRLGIVLRVVIFQSIALGEIWRNARAALTAGSLCRLAIA